MLYAFCLHIVCILFTYFNYWKTASAIAFPNPDENFLDPESNDILKELLKSPIIYIIQKGGFFQ